MHVEKAALVVYKNDQDKNVLCYEFFTTKGKDTYHIFINAITGLQENVNLLSA
jgi:spore germination protein